MVHVLRSIPQPAAIGDLVRRAYGLDVRECRLLRSFVNDVYDLTGADGRFVLKVYHAGGWSTDEVAWEFDLVSHLAASGISVARVVPLTSGSLVGEFDAPEGIRPFGLTEYVDGDKPRPPLNDELYHAYGALLARLHRATEDFRTTHSRRAFGLELTLDEPLAQVLPELANQPEDQALVKELGGLARQRMTELAALGLDWGIRHGDVTLDNVHLTGEGLTIHDFDLAAVGWRAGDLTSCLSTAFADAFAAGYRSVRTIGSADLSALPWLRVIESIGNLRFHLVDKPAWRGTESLSEGWAEQILTDFRSSARDLLECG
ncbi:phosphotransferase enzyme family protein [Actinopolymorpha alba]|uniref:phosphotransferase enzyme family protein n=1 Tax=Actinopolymorpha alba TaxID=533267 RepID=UPI0003701291|nr:phosphotransferase [Actinopolymorpha alba]